MYNQKEEWGITCNKFLDSIKKHPSKASNTYYYKNHIQYFESIFNSLKEISRILKSGGLCSLIVQDSHYKEIHNDLPKIFIEMCEIDGLKLFLQSNFKSNRTRAGHNPAVRNHRKVFNQTESVLCFLKEN